jgi:hypothetical protein
MFSVFDVHYLFLTLLQHPLWFQAIKASSPLSSGVMLLPLIIGNLVAALMVGWMLTRVGYPHPFVVTGSTIVATGLGLLTTLEAGTGRSAWIIYQALIDGVIGLGMQAALRSTQIVLSDQDVAIGIAIMGFAFVLGGALFVPIPQTIFANRVASTSKAIIRKAPSAGLFLASSSVTQVLIQVSTKDRAQAVAAYNNAVLLTFFAPLATGLVTFLSGLGVRPYLSVKEKGE